MLLRNHMVVLSRSPRQLGEEWDKARSWFGGAPKLGNVSWPCGEGNRPRAFLAQLDCAEIKAAGGPAELPSNGSLAFFLQDFVYVPEGQNRIMSDLPADLPDFLEYGVDPIYKGDIYGRKLCPFWPVDFTSQKQIVAPEFEEAEAKLDFNHFISTVFDPGSVENLLKSGIPFRKYNETLDKFSENQNEFVTGNFDRANCNLTPDQVFGDLPAIQWWNTAILLTTSPYLKADAKDELKDLCRGRDPWSVMEDAAVKQVKDIASSNFKHCEEVTLRMVATGPDQLYETLPATAREKINAIGLMPRKGRHQMFGVPLGIQGDAQLENCGNLLLLQLYSDYMMFWDINCGVFQFWISRKDLDEKNWSGVKMTFDA